MMMNPYLMQLMQQQMSPQMGQTGQNGQPMGLAPGAMMSPQINQMQRPQGGAPAGMPMQMPQQGQAMPGQGQGQPTMPQGMAALMSGLKSLNPQQQGQAPGGPGAQNPISQGSPITPQQNPQMASMPTMGGNNTVAGANAAYANQLGLPQNMTGWGQQAQTSNPGLWQWLSSQAGSMGG